jgi:hypothetical protein
MNALFALPIVQRGALAGAALVAVALVLAFHSVVAGAVERAAHRRAEAQLVALQSAAVRRPVQSTYFTARKVSLAGASD